MKLKPCGPCTVRCDRHLSEAFLHLTLESSNWWKPRRFFVFFIHVSKRLPLKKSPLFCHSGCPRFNAAQVEFGPTAMPFLPIGNDISFNPFRQLKCRKHSMMPRHLPKFLMWKLQGIPERGIGIGVHFEGLQDRFGHVFSTKSSKPNEWNEFRVPPRSPQALWPAWRTKWTWTTWKCPLMWETNDPQNHFHGNLRVPPNATQEMRPY